jgi:hypothetical protein
VYRHAIMGLLPLLGCVHEALARGVGVSWWLLLWCHGRSLQRCAAQHGIAVCWMQRWVCESGSNDPAQERLLFSLNCPAAAQQSHATNTPPQA